MTEAMGHKKEDESKYYASSSVSHRLNIRLNRWTFANMVPVGAQA